ncbi:Unknown protein sequence [Pseudomonas coronafaciens pv. oryzae]|nr:Unknown protein sequence [Pseudomonas coronafaciens pv. oryzae]
MYRFSFLPDALNAVNEPCRRWLLNGLYLRCSRGSAVVMFD